jgi:putative hydrolase of the HAD superfamily
MKKQPIQLFIFDLGRVLVDFDFRKVIRKLSDHTPKNQKEIHHFFKTTPLWDTFERGKMSAPEFFESMKKDLELDMSYRYFLTHWSDIFEPKHDSIEIVKKLRTRYQLAMLSNVNVLHWSFLRDRHDFMHWFQPAIASYKVGYRKPDPEIFELTVEKAKVKPEHAVFTDDIRAHIHAARKTGIRAHHFTTATQFKKDIADLLK